MAEKSPDELEALFTYFNEIGIIAQLSSNMFEKRLPDGLTLSQFSVLNWFVRVDRVASPGRLAKAFQVTGGAMTNTLQKLQSKGFVRVEPDKKSGRSKTVTMTAAGRRVRDQAIREMGEMLQEFAGEFDVSRLPSQTRQLARVRKYLDELRYR